MKHIKNGFLLVGLALLFALFLCVVAAMALAPPLIATHFLNVYPPIATFIWVFTVIFAVGAMSEMEMPMWIKKANDKVESLSARFNDLL